MSRWVMLVVILAGTLAVKAQGDWTRVAPGVWKMRVGSSSFVSILGLLHNTPDSVGLGKLGEVEFPLRKEDISFRVGHGEIYLRLPLDTGETLSGLGLNFKTVNQRGRILNLHVDHYGGVDNGRTHAPVPFYVSSKGYGVLIDAAEYITVYAGTAVRKDAQHPPVAKDRNTDKSWEADPYSDAVEIKAPGEGVDVYVFAGPRPLNVVQRYNLFNGGGCLPPKWGLGFTQRLPTLSTSADILHEADDFEKHGFPLDFIGVEPGWQSKSYPCSLEWDSTRFPDPAGFNRGLMERKLRSNVWFNPYISPASRLYGPLRSLSGSHTVWNGLVPDILLPETRALLKEHFLKYIIGAGVSGFKIDEVDGYDNWLWPDVASFPSGVSASEMRQVFGLLMQQVTTGWFHGTGVRTFGLVRASNAGASSLPYVIYNDYYSHRDFITALINSGYIGVLWTPEVRSSKSAEEWLRRIQTVCFSPMAMINAWSDGTKPWSFPEVEKAVREMALLRMQLLPYIYSTFAQYHFEGKPPFRGMNLEEGAVVKGEIKDQYMMGDNILVAPLFTGEKRRKVALPAGKWYDFYTGVLAGENEVIEVEPGLEKIPLFVRDGGIIPMIGARRQAPGPSEMEPLIVRHYGSAPGSFVLYDDDGVSYDYEKGRYSMTTLSVARDKKGRLQGSQPTPSANKPYHYTSISWQFMTKQ
ncbi:MAG TPA: TIM-barrel domain-containing protein [Puia sp.]|nr:TIM-barrel domain-containing protein [Puia sp.]